LKAKLVAHLHAMGGLAQTPALWSLRFSVLRMTLLNPAPRMVHTHAGRTERVGASPLRARPVGVRVLNSSHVAAAIILLPGHSDQCSELYRKFAKGSACSRKRLAIVHANSEAMECGSLLPLSLRPACWPCRAAPRLDRGGCEQARWTKAAASCRTPDLVTNFRPEGHRGKASPTCCGRLQSPRTSAWARDLDQGYSSGARTESLLTGV